MEMPKPTQEHQRLAQLAGDWVGEEIVHPGPWNPQGAKATGRMQARIALDGFYLISDHEHEVDGRILFRGHGVWGWDARGKCYTMHWFDSSGIEHGAPALGTWEGNILTLQHETGHLGHSRYVYELRDAELYQRIEWSQDGSRWTAFLEGTYRRAG